MSKLNPLQFLEPIFRSLVNHARVQRSILDEQQKQTIILTKLLNYYQDNSGDDDKEGSVQDKLIPVVIHPPQVQFLLNLAPSYATVKCRKIKKAAGVPKGEPLPLKAFCEVLKLDYATVVKRLKLFPY